MVARADSYRIISPGSPIPISFGMGKDPSQSMSLNPGSGSGGTDIFGSSLSSGGGGYTGAPSSGGIPASWQPNASLSVTNLAPVHVSAATLGSAPMFGGMYGGMGGGGSVGGGVAPSGVHVKDLAPVHVTAQMPVQPSLGDRYMQWYNDHKMLGGLAEGLVKSAIPTLAPVLAIGHAYYNNKHGQPLISGLGGLGSLGSSLSSLLGSAPGGPLSSNGADMYGNFFGGSGSGLNNSGGSGWANSVLPNYPGLAAKSAVPASLPGAYWNQLAIHDAAPAYGPFSGPGQHNLPTAPSGIFGV